MLRAARSIIKSTRSYGFVCTQGLSVPTPTCRIMDLHRLTDDNLDFSLISRSFTRKAHSFRANSGCTIAFHDPRVSSESGYLVLSGDVREIASLDERRDKWKPSWSLFHPANADDVVMWQGGRTLTTALVIGPYNTPDSR